MDLAVAWVHHYRGRPAVAAGRSDFCFAGNKPVVVDRPVAVVQQGVDAGHYCYRQVLAVLYSEVVVY